MKPLQFGISPTPDASRYNETVRLVTLAEELGLDMVGIQDHPYQRRFLDTFALLSVLLARTERITLFPDVASLPVRGAVSVAKVGASLDVMFPGRFQVGLGAGAFWDAVEGLGGPRRSPGEAVDAFEEALDVIEALWSGERGLQVDGDHYRLAGAHSGPVPTTGIDVWVGAGGSRMLSIIGRRCDGWIPSSSWLPPEGLAPRHRLIDEAAEEAGRHPEAIRRIYNVVGRIRPGPATGFLEGDHDHWVEELAGVADEGRMDSFVLMLAEEAETQVRAFAEVAAALSSP